MTTRAVTQLVVADSLMRIGALVHGILVHVVMLPEFSSAPPMALVCPNWRAALSALPAAARDGPRADGGALTWEHLAARRDDAADAELE
eukprot:1168152-Pyramimonas_sp.AAC.2